MKRRIEEGLERMCMYVHTANIVEGIGSIDLSRLSHRLIIIRTTWLVHGHARYNDKSVPFCLRSR